MSSGNFQKKCGRPARSYAIDGVVPTMEKIGGIGHRLGPVVLTWGGSDENPPFNGITCRIVSVHEIR